VSVSAESPAALICRATRARAVPVANLRACRRQQRQRSIGLVSAPNNSNLPPRQGQRGTRLRRCSCRPCGASSQCNVGFGGDTDRAA
jgi:hypothetical protein